jgi:hypothetical protein
MSRSYTNKPIIGTANDLVNLYIHHSNDLFMAHFLIVILLFPVAKNG